MENCQIGVVLAYANSRGHALLDRDLSLPKEWANDPIRYTSKGRPVNAFATKPQLARQMLERPLHAGVPVALPAAGWTRCSAGHGAKSPRWYDWTWLPQATLVQADVGAS